jgi:hypothetical protein
MKLAKGQLSTRKDESEELDLYIIYHVYDHAPYLNVDVQE